MELLEEVLPKTDVFTSTVISLVPFEINEKKPGLYPGFFQIEESDTVTPKLLHVKESKHFVYLDSSRGHLPVKDSSALVADSICNDFISGQLDLADNARPALLWVPGSITFKEIEKYHSFKLELARRSQRQWMINRCKTADDDWKRYNKHNVVSDHQRKFANLLGYKASEHPWMVMDEALNLSKCPKCTSRIERDQVVCLGCKYILKPSEFKAEEFAK